MAFVEFDQKLLSDCTLRTKGNAVPTYNKGWKNSGLEAYPFPFQQFTSTPRFVFLNFGDIRFQWFILNSAIIIRDSS